MASQIFTFSFPPRGTNNNIKFENSKITYNLILTFEVESYMILKYNIQLKLLLLLFFYYD